MSQHSSMIAFTKLRSFISRQGRGKFAWVSASLFIASLLEMFTAFIIALLAESLIYPQKAYHYLHKFGLMATFNKDRVILYIALLTGFIYLVKSFFGSLSVFISNKCILQEAHAFKIRFLELYSKMPYESYLVRNSADFISTMNGEADVIFSSGLFAVIQIASECLVFALLLVAVAFLNPLFFLIIAALSGVLVVLSLKFLFPLNYRLGDELRSATRSCNRYALQFIHAFKDIILSTKLPYFLNKYTFYSKRKSVIESLQLTFIALPRFFLETFFVLVFIAVVCFMIFTHQETQKIFMLLGGYLYAGFRFMPGMNRVVNFVSIFKSLIPSINNVHKEYTSLGALRGNTQSKDFDFTKNITFKQVSFCYQGAKEGAIQDVSFSISRGECIGIVGATGSGKSTLTDLMLGLLHPTQGEILVDECYPVDSEQWRQRVGYVSQVVHLIDDTMAANIIFGEDTVDSVRLEQVIREAQLSELVAKLPNGVNTEVGERGMRLSGGERQRIAIARVLYRQPQVLIFDEATSALDNATEEALIEVMREVSVNRTVIMIAHRLTTLKHCNRILVVKSGKLAQEVTYAALANEVLYT